MLLRRLVSVGFVGVLHTREKRMNPSASATIRGHEPHFETPGHNLHLKTAKQGFLTLEEGLDRVDDQTLVEAVGRARNQ